MVPTRLYTKRAYLYGRKETNFIHVDIQAQKVLLLALAEKVKAMNLKHFPANVLLEIAGYIECLRWTFKLLSEVVV